MAERNYLEYLTDNVIKDDAMAHAFGASHDLSETHYKANILPDKDVVRQEDFVRKFISYELLPVRKSAQLRKVLYYYLYENSTELTEAEKSKCARNIKVLTLLLSSVSEGSYTFESIGNVIYLKSNASYGYTKKHTCGRLYPQRVSINQLSKEFRHYLFNDIYSDVDIVNAHPTILYEFAKGKGIHSPTLQFLVEDRDRFYSRIREDYPGARINTKKLVLICLNMISSQFKSPELNSLSSDLKEIRLCLRQELYDKDELFKSAIDFRCGLNTEDGVKLLKIQSLYCFNMETESIVSFMAFYDHKIPLELRKATSFVPFFDGLYIHSDSLYNLNTLNMCMEITTVNLNDIIKEYNKDHAIKFMKKKIESTHELIKVETFNSILSTIKHIDNMNYSEIKKEIGSDDALNKLLEYVEPLLDDTSSDANFSYEQLNSMQRIFIEIYNKLIEKLRSKNTP